jgi:hypothetical protein
MGNRYGYFYWILGYRPIIATALEVPEMDDAKRRTALAKLERALGQ